MGESRVHERVPYRVKLWCYHYYNDLGERVNFETPVMMEAFDVSLGGLGIVTRLPLPKNSTLEFTFYLENIPYQVMTQIKWHNTNYVFHRYGLEIIGHNNMLFRHLQQFVKGDSILEAK
ncbi:PilZ domain-containing protein [Acidaminobacter sp. JC074]|uniref:PilZ domain-containing protein n=1 Tax=Acidaminobacter sp. JC074 TaxID=2530199 RepID=UPI001F0D565E|nr:PilZ domain-containing protein [Acidaminobacter sp. JC074]MCH4889092.1 PilZ domain-containing protein [Acidaminobacter sp. JC074]